MSTVHSKWEIDESGDDGDYIKTNQKSKELELKDNMDLYCPALPPNLEKKGSLDITDANKTTQLRPRKKSVENVEHSPSVSYEYHYSSSNSDSADSDSDCKVKEYSNSKHLEEVKFDSTEDKYSQGVITSKEFKKDFYYDQVAIITDDQYVQYVKHLRRPEVLILSDENLKVVELEKYLPENLDKSCRRTLFLLVVGVNSITKQVPANYCKIAGCDKPLQALNSQTDFEKHFSKFVKKLQAMLIKVKKCLPMEANIAILPPLPIALHSSYKNHQILHSKQSQFPCYMIDNMGDSIAKWYPVWINKLFEISQSTFAACHFENISIFNELDDQDYKNVQVMTCRKGFDKPSYNLWMKVIENLVTDMLQNASNEVHSAKIADKPSTDRNLTTFDVNIPNSSKANEVKSSLLIAENSPATVVEYDHIVFIGFAVSVKLLPDILFSSYSQWHLDDNVAVSNSFSLQISALNSQNFKKVLFIFLSDINMISSEEKNSECILKHCEELITYIKAPSNPVSLIKNIKISLASLKQTISEMKKYCNFQSKFVIAPFTPRIYIPISSIIFHKNMHTHLQKQICTRFLRGSTKQYWNETLRKFESEWNKYMLEVLHNNDEGILNIKSWVMSYIENNNGSISWKDLFAESLDAEYPNLSIWQSCIISIAVKAWVKSSDSPIVKTEKVEITPTVCESPVSNNSVKINENKLSDNLHLKDIIDNGERDLLVGESEMETDQASKSGIYRDADEVFRFSKSMLSKGSSSHSLIFNNLFIIGQKENISPLLDCNIKSTMIYHKLVSFEDSDIQILLQKIGKFREKDACCLVFDISIISKELISTWCLKNSCSLPIFGTALKIENVDPMKELDQLISNQLKSILKFTRKLSQHIPTIILPLSPARMYLEDEYSPCHQISHKLSEMGCPIIYGSFSLWDIAIRSFILSWSNLMDLTNKKYDLFNYVTSYIKSKPNIFIIIDDINDYISEWLEFDVWKAVVEIFLVSLVPLKRIHHVKKYSSSSSGKFRVVVSQMSSSIPSKFLEELFCCADENVIVTKKRDTYILEELSLSRARLLVVKLDNFHIGDSVLKCYIDGIIDGDDTELSLMQKLYIYSSLENIYKKWKQDIINNLEKKIDEVPNIITLKARPCDKGDRCRGPKVCINYHSSLDKRRNPFLHQYSDVLCRKPKVDNICEDGEQCNFSHNAFEVKFHPTKYQIKVCPAGSIADICNSQDLCKFAHEDSPEMFYNSKWEDVIVIGAQYSLLYFTGAIRAISKLKDSKRSKLKVCLISPSPEFLDISIRASRNLIDAFGISVCDLENNLSNSDTSEILIGNPSSFVSLNVSIFNDTFGAIIIDNTQQIMKNVVSNESLIQFLQMIAKGASNGVFNKVFVCPCYDKKTSSDINETYGLQLKQLFAPDSGIPADDSSASAPVICLDSEDDSEDDKKKNYDEESDDSMLSSDSRKRSWRRSSSRSKMAIKTFQSEPRGGGKGDKEKSQRNRSRSSSRLRNDRRKLTLRSSNNRRRSQSPSRDKRKRRSRSGSKSNVRKRRSISGSKSNVRKPRSRSRSLPRHPIRKSRSRSNDRRKRRSRSGSKSNVRKRRSISGSKSNVRKPRSRSRSLPRHPLRKSRSRSKGRRRKSIEKKENDKKNKPFSKDETKTDEIMEMGKLFGRFKKGFPPIKENHLSVCTTTLWVGHLSKSVDIDELSKTFGIYGEIASIDLVAARGCAYVSMNRREDAHTALKELKKCEIKNKAVILAWAPGLGVKGKDFKDFWDLNAGCTYIPHDKLFAMTNLDFNQIEKGGMIDNETVPLSLKVHFENRPQLTVLPVNVPYYQPVHQNVPLPAVESYPSEIIMPTSQLPHYPALLSIPFDQIYPCAVEKKETSASTYMDQMKKEMNRRLNSKKEKSVDKKNQIENIFPPSKENHLTICSTTLWVGSLSKAARLRDLEKAFGKFGDVLSIDIDPSRACAYICFTNRKSVLEAINATDLKIKNKAVIVGWAPGKGLKDKGLGNYWYRELGCSYIPHEQVFNMNIFDLNALEEGGWIDQETIPLSLKVSKPSDTFPKGSYRSQILDAYSKTNSHGNWRSESRSLDPNRSNSSDLHERSRSSERISMLHGMNTDYIQTKYSDAGFSGKNSSGSRSPVSSKTYGATNLPLSLQNLEHSAKPVSLPSYDSVTDLRKLFGEKLFEEYSAALEEINNVFDKDFNIYFSVPELYPNYNKYYDSFASMYVVQHRGKNAQHKERLWKLYWKSVFDDIKNEEWEKIKNNVVEEYKTRAGSQSSFSKSYFDNSPAMAMKRRHFSGAAKEDFMNTKPSYNLPESYSSIDEATSSHKYRETSDQRWQMSQPVMAESMSIRSGSSFANENEFLAQRLQSSSSSPTLSNAIIHKQHDTYSYSKTINLIEKLSDNIGFLGPSVKALIKTCYDLGTTTKEGYELLSESENIMLIGMLLDKFKSLCQSATGDTLQLYKKVIEWIPKMLHEAEIGPTLKAEDIRIDLEAIGRASHGKEPKFALEMIKTAIAYEGINNPPKEVINELFLKVCSIHFSISMES